MKNIFLLIILLLVAGFAVIYFYTPATILVARLTPNGGLLLKYCDFHTYQVEIGPHCHWIWESQHYHLL